MRLTSLSLHTGLHMCTHAHTKEEEEERRRGKRRRKESRKDQANFIYRQHRMPESKEKYLDKNDLKCRILFPSEMFNKEREQSLVMFRSSITQKV